MNSTIDTEGVTDFDETFRVCRARNSKTNDKKIFFQSFCFHGDKPKILKIAKIDVQKKPFFPNIVHDQFLPCFYTKERSKIKTEDIFRFLVKRRI